MAIKVCPVCGREYDDEMNESCPFCKEQETKEDILEPAEEIKEDVGLQEESGASSDADNQDIPGDEAGGSKGLKIAALVLAVVLVVLAAFFAYTKLIAPKKSENYLSGIIKSEVEDSIDNAKKFSAKDLDGTFSDDINLIYYTFSQGKASIEIPLETEETSDSAADSSAGSALDSAKKAVTASETVEYEGTYTSGMTQKGIRQMVIIDYIEDNGLTQDYMSYLEEKDILSSDFEGFIKEKGLEDDLGKFDSEGSLSQKYAFDKTEGYWNFDDGIITLFDENGEQTGEYKVTDKGIINADYLYEGNLPSKNDVCAVYSMEMENYGMTQNLSIRLYRDGYCVLEVDGDSQSLQAGTYKTDDKGVYININGQNIFFYVTDLGICNEILNK